MRKGDWHAVVMNVFSDLAPNGTKDPDYEKVRLAMSKLTARELAAVERILHLARAALRDTKGQTKEGE
jgi:hypothetical protein